MDFEEHEEDQEEEMDMAAAEQHHPPGYESFGNSGRSRMAVSGGEGALTVTGRKIGSVRYRECLKNHAVNIGGHAVDGCCEFMAAGEDGTLDALKCAACNCHRNFHRKETDGGGGDGMFQNHPFSPYYRAAAGPAGYLHMTAAQVHHRPLALPAASAGGGGYSRDDEDISNPSSSGGGSGTRKRFRTKFTAEQKEKMLGFAETLGWRIQKHDEGAVEQFCAETGVRRQVLKVWMHNNKHTLGKKP